MNTVRETRGKRIVIIWNFFFQRLHSPKLHARLCTYIIIRGGYPTYFYFLILLADNERNARVVRAASCYRIVRRLDHCV